jgi:hypothetical protein
MKRKTADPDPAPEAASKPPDPAFWTEVLRTCGSFNLRKATRVITQLYDDILQPTGLRSTQVVLLVALAAEGEMSMSYMARELIMSPSTLSRTFLPLEREGLNRHRIKRQTRQTAASDDSRQKRSDQCRAVLAKGTGKISRAGRWHSLARTQCKTGRYRCGNSAFAPVVHHSSHDLHA